MRVDTSFEIWSLQTRKNLFSSPSYLKDAHSASISEDGSIIAIGNGTWPGLLDDIPFLTKPKDGRIAVLFLPELNPTPIVLSKHKNSVKALDISSDGTMLVSGDEDGKVIVWSLDMMKPDK